MKSKHIMTKIQRGHVDNPTAGNSLPGIKHSRTFRQRGKGYKPGLRPAFGRWLLITRPAGPWDVPARSSASGVNTSKHNRPNSPAASQTANFIPVAQSSPMRTCPCEEAGSQPRRAYITVWRHLCVTLYSSSVMLARGYGRSHTEAHWQKWPERWQEEAMQHGPSWSWFTWCDDGEDDMDLFRDGRMKAPKHNVSTAPLVADQSTGSWIPSLLLVVCSKKKQTQYMSNNCTF